MSFIIIFLYSLKIAKNCHLHSFAFFKDGFYFNNINKIKIMTKKNIKNTTHYIPMSSITITNPIVIDFLNTNCYDPDKFLGQLIINYKKPIIKDCSTSNPSNKIEIDKDELLEFYEEYQFFLSQKQNLINISREHHKNFQQNLNRVKFQKMDEFFSKNLRIKRNTYTCSICKIYSVTTKKGLVTHERNCRYKNSFIEEEDNNDELESTDDSISVENEKTIESKESPKEQTEIKEPAKSTNIEQASVSVQPPLNPPTNVKIPIPLQIKKPTVVAKTTTQPLSQPTQQTQSLTKMTLTTNPPPVVK
jgi:hypothetical protein